MTRKTTFKSAVWPLAALALLAVAALAWTANQRQETAKIETHAGHEQESAIEHADEAHGKTTAKDEHGHAAETGHAGESVHQEGDGHDHGGEAGHVDEVNLTPDAIQKNGIKIEPTRRNALGETFTVPARISYNNEAMAHIGTPVEGRVSEIKVKLGSQVKMGDTLLVIDSPTLGEAQSDWLQKRMQVQVAQSALDVAQTAAERAKRLLDGKGISLGEYQRREGEFKAARGALRTAEAAATAAENKLHLWGMSQADVERLVKTGEIDPRFVVHAPLAGSVVAREATLGEVVGPDRESLLVLADMKTLWVLADVPENQVKHIAVGTSATLTVEALGAEKFSGRVTYIAPEMNRETRTAQVRVEVEDGHSPLKPGMFAQVKLSLARPVTASNEHSLVVPEDAVHNFEGGQAVFVAMAGEPGKFIAKMVKVGPSNGQLVPVLDGLEDGTPVVTHGSFIIKAELAKSIMEGKTCSGH